MNFIEIKCHREHLSHERAHEACSGSGICIIYGIYIFNFGIPSSNMIVVLGEAQI